MENAIVSSSTCPREYGGPFAELGYTYTCNGSYYSGFHQEPFFSHNSAEEYVAGFPVGSQITVRVNPVQPETSVFCE